MTREKAIKIMRKEIECLSHSRCRDCILEKVCDPNTNPSDDEYIEAFGMAINSLEIDERYELEYEQIEPCEDAISRQAVLDAIEDDNRNGHYSCFASNNDAQCFKGVIGELPSVNPQEPFMNKPCVAHQVCHEDKIKVLDKIRAEIEALNPVDYVSMSSYEGHRGASDMKNDVLQIINKYKAGSEE